MLFLLIALGVSVATGVDASQDAPGGQASDPAPLFLDEWGAFKAGRPSFVQPMSVAASPDGFVYVLDWEGGNVLRFTEAGAFVTSWKVPMAFPKPARMLNALAASDRAVYVSDLSGECIHQFTPDGKLKGHLDYEAGLNGLAVDPLGNLYVAGFHVSGASREGPALWKINRLGEVLNHWDREVGAVAVDGEGTVYAMTELYKNGPVSILHLSPWAAAFRRKRSADSGKRLLMPSTGLPSTHEATCF